jgi:mono/diheme cytochrome c family protein
MMKPFILVSAMVALALAPAAMKGGSPQEAASTASASKARITPELQTKAKKLYVMDCAMCHDANGDGKTDLAKGMNVTLGDWSDAKTLADKQDDVLFEVIRKGKGNMPAEADSRADDALVHNLIHYIRGLSKGSAVAAAHTAQ